MDSKREETRKVSGCEGAREHGGLFGGGGGRVGSHDEGEMKI
jgi:hypothetical protein